MKSEFIIPPQGQPEAIIRRLQAQGYSIDAAILKGLMRSVRFSTQFQANMERHFQRYGLSQPGFMILMLLYSRIAQTYTAAELTGALAVRPSTMTGLLDTLQKQGLIGRRAIEGDRRKNAIVLTDAGRDRLEEILPDHLRRLAEAFDILTEPGFIKAQERVFRNMEQALESLTEDC